MYNICQHQVEYVTMTVCMMLVSLSGYTSTLHNCNVYHASYIRTLEHNFNTYSMCSMLLLDWFGTLSCCMMYDIAQRTFVRFRVILFN